MDFELKNLEEAVAAFLEFNMRFLKIRDDGPENLEQQSQRLRIKVEQLYALAAVKAQAAQSLEEVTTIWAYMVSICDKMAQELSKIFQDPATCPECFNHILSIRDVCEENRALHA
jgi:hypothetical protein